MSSDYANNTNGAARSTEPLDSSNPPASEPTAAQQDPTCAHVRLPEDKAHAIVQIVAAHMLAERDEGRFHIDGEEVVGNHLSGGCCIAAAIAALVAMHHGCRAIVVGGYPFAILPDRRNHWNVQTNCGWILDPTFGQFVWHLKPVAVHGMQVLDPISRVDVHEFMRWRGFPALEASKTLPLFHQRTINRILTKLTGAPYAAP